MIPFKRILCPIDFSESSRLALDHAVALARWYRAELRALHVYTAPAGIGPGFPQLAGRLSVGDQETLRRRLASLFASVRASGVRVRNSVRVGDPATEILAPCGAGVHGPHCHGQPRSRRPGPNSVRFRRADSLASRAPRSRDFRPRRARASWFGRNAQSSSSGELSGPRSVGSQNLGTLS